MSYSSLELIWAIIAVFTVLLILAISVSASIVVHSRKIKESEHKFRLLFNRVFDTLLLMDESGLMVDANESACRLLGYSKDDLLKLNLRELIPDERYSEFQADLEKSIEKLQYALTALGWESLLDGSMGRFNS